MRVILRRRLIKLAAFLCLAPAGLYMLTSKPKGNARGETLEFKTQSKIIPATSPMYSQPMVSDSGMLLNDSLLSGQQRSLPMEKSRQINGTQSAIDFCNSPFMTVTGQEGRFTEGFKLRNIHVFIHHGDVTSVHQLPGQEAEAFNCKFSTWYTGSNEKFKRFPAHMNKMGGKQGRRNHFLNWALYPDRDICVGSVLTSKGALQHLKLGQHLFDAYSKYSSLIDPNLSLTNQMKVKSTMTSRTYQSAVAFLYGFLPSFNISQTEIDHSPDLNFCTKQFSIQKSCYCKNAKALKIRAEKFQNRFDRDRLHSKRLRQYIAADLHFSNFESAPSTRTLAEALFPYFCHNISMSCSYSNFYDCQTMMGDLWNAVTAEEMSKYDDPEQNFLKYSSIIMTPVLVEIIHRIKDVTENHHVPQIVLYSGHDDTLSSLLLLLGLWEGKRPPYASRAVMELFEDLSDPSFSKFYLRFLYNGVDRTGDVLFCKDRTFKGLCKLNFFIEFVYTKMLKRFGFQNYYDACSR